MCLLNALVDKISSKCHLSCIAQEVDSPTFETWRFAISNFTKLLDDVRFDEIEPILQSLQAESLPYETTSTEDEATLDFNRL